MYTLQLLGGGRMGEALLGGLLAAGTLAPDQVAVVEIDPARRAHLADRFADVTLLEQPGACAGLIVATKPADVGPAVAAAAAAGVERIVSIAAGVSTASIESAAGRDLPVVRAMPNTPALVGAGAAAIAGGRHVAEGDLAWAESVLGAVGTVVRVPEGALDAVTGLSGSGPAYVFLVAEALIDAGVNAGLPRATADALVRQTLLGSAMLLAHGDDGPEALRAAVTSPGGTTAAGLRVLEERALRAALIDAVAAATQRSRELGA
jgi:pyrroline-5-carboxylate reductase